MNKTTLYVILGVALGLLVGFVLVMYLLRPQPPTVNVERDESLTISQIVSGPPSRNLSQEFV